MTDAERRLWAALRGRRLQGYKFRRQHPLGSFVLDFVCMEHRLVIEADGGQHSDNEADRRRTRWLESRGWRVIRFWNNEILSNTEGVVETILRTLAPENPWLYDHSPQPPSPSHRKRGGSLPLPLRGRGATR
jgi:very-short-patch-repair endonuclease